jgi:hypothetical protein
MNATEPHAPTPRITTAKAIAPLIFLIGLISALLGLPVALRAGLATGLALFFCGLAAMALAQVLELLKAIEADLSAIRTGLDAAALSETSSDVAAIRTQLGMGVFGLLGSPKK